MPRTSGFKKKQFSEKKTAPGSDAAQDKWLVQKNVSFLNKKLPQAAMLPGTSGLFEKKVRFLRKTSAQDSEAARDKRLVKQKSSF